MPSLTAPLPGTLQSIPTIEDVARISAIADPVQRNQQITACYHDLSQSFSKRTGPIANWCTFARWASSQAGVTIRKEDLKRKLEEVLTNDPVIQAVLMLIAQLAGQLGRKGKLPGISFAALEKIIESAGDKASDAVARGNKKVFEEIGKEFARFLKECSPDTVYNDASITSFINSLKDGPPPEGQAYLQSAFRRYYKSLFESDSNKKSEAMLMANIEIGYHEQTRLQPEIKESLDAAFVDSEKVKKSVTDLIVSSQSIAGKLYYFFQWITGQTDLLKKQLDALIEKAESIIRMILTRQLMTLNLPPDRCLHLGDDLSITYPQDLLIIEDEELNNLLEKLKKQSGQADGAGCTDWANFDQRIHYIAILFRCYHKELVISD